MTDEGAEAVPADGTDAALDAVDEAIDETVEISDFGGQPGGVVDGDNPAPSRRPGIRTVVGAAVLAALVGATGFLGWTVWQQHQLSAASQEAQRAAVSYAEVLTSIDSDKVDENFKEVLDGATGEFKDMYSQSSVELRQLLV
ncbi:MAG: hypothetical protein WAO90_03790, partial [Mycobacterium sp.]